VCCFMLPTLWWLVTAAIQTNRGERNELLIILKLSRYLQEQIWGAFHNPLTPELYTINFTIKTLCLPILFLWIRASYPWFRYDQLIHLLWKNFLPLTLAVCILYVSLLIAISSIPPQI
jgi:NADH:ubiquinone oxidoreductase subunit H